MGAQHCPPHLHALSGLRAAGVVGGRPPTWPGAVRSLWGGSVAFVCRGTGWLGGGGGGPCAGPRVCAARGACRAGGCSASFRPSAFPRHATKRVLLASLWSWGAWSPYHSSSCSPAFTGRDLCGVLARWRGLACSPRFLWELAARAGGRAVLRLLSRAGGGGTISPASGDGGRGSAACGPVGGVGRGGSRRGLPAPPLGGGRRFPTLAPLLSSAHSPPACAFGQGRGAAPGGGGMRGRQWTAPPGAPSDLNPPSALPEWAMVMGGVMGGAASILFWCAAVRRPQAWSACRSGALVWARPSAATPREQAAGGAGARGVQVPPHPPPPPPASRSLLGEGGRPLGLRGGGGLLLWPSSWGGERGGGVGGAAPPPPAPPAPSGVDLPSVVSGVPLRGILVPWGLPGGRGRRARPGRPPMGQCGEGGGGEGGGTPQPGSRPRLPQAGL